MSDKNPIRFSTAGNRKSPPLLLLHGFLGSAREWKDCAGILSQRFFCIIPNLPGHGNSPVNLNHDNPFESLSEQLHELVRSLTDRKINLLGYSMGGRIALHFTLKYPEAVESLVLESVNPGIPDGRERSLRCQWEAEVAHRLENSSMDDFLNYWFDLAVFSSLKTKVDLLEKLRDLRRSHDPGKLAEVFKLLGTGRQLSLWTHLRGIKAPVLLICGSEDEKYLRISREASAVIPDSYLKIIPDAGHNTHIENLHDFIISLDFFFERIC